MPFVFSMSGETLDVGLSTGAAVGPYPANFPFTATIRTVVIATDLQLSPADHDEVRRGTHEAAAADH